MNFLGYELKGSVIAASCPATENLENIISCVDNGASAVILKSASSTRMNDGKTRICHIDTTGFWAESGFDREILPIEKAVELTSAAANSVSIPIISSVIELTLEVAPWITSCNKLEKAGADALQLDFFYLPNLLSDKDFSNKFIRLLKEVQTLCQIPIMPKLNIGLPAEFAVNLLKEANIKYVSLLDSIRSPAPNGAYLSGESLSVFNSFQLPITRQYTKILSDAGLSVCAGGGVTNAEQAADLLFLGAKTVQIATEILLNGFSRIGEIDRDIPAYLRSFKPQIDIQQREAVFNADKCTGCGKCTTQTFCPVAKNRLESNYYCEGCGLCAYLCESGAIQVTVTNCPK